MTEAHEHHEHPNYLAVFGVLIVLTAVSFFTVSPFWLNTMGHRSGPMVVMIVGVIKATLVAMYFMHLKYDWFKLYYMIVPALILGTFLVCALLPDMVFSPTLIRK
jgi:caa(3)-type oxidase subunit IV